MVMTPPLGVDRAAALMALAIAAEPGGVFFFFTTPLGLTAEGAFLVLAILGLAAAFFAALGFAGAVTEVVTGMGSMLTEVADAAFFVDLVFLGGASTLASGASSADAL